MCGTYFFYTAVFNGSVILLFAFPAICIAGYKYFAVFDGSFDKTSNAV
jgi:hypothetical protein